MHIGNDAVDFSGSKVILNNAYFSSISDKAISVGENSKVELEVSSEGDVPKLLELKSIKIKKTTELRNEINTLLSN